MNEDGFCGFHTTFYFIVAGIGLFFVFVAKNFPLYNEITGEIIRPYSLLSLIFGAVLLVFSFIGIAFFCEYGEKK